MVAFLHLHRCQLRGLAPDEVTRARVAAAGLEVPGVEAALTQISGRVAAAYRAGRLDGFGARTISTRLTGIGLAQAGCERIRATPLPYVYSLLVFRTTWLYVLLLPLALLENSGWMTPVFTVIVAYTFFGLAEVTEELAHPFGATANALPLDAICRAVEISLAPIWVRKRRPAAAGKLSSGLKRLVARPGVSSRARLPQAPLASPASAMERAV
ncbi:bestrophin family ion channel [Gemmobacter lanyuensis]